MRIVAAILFLMALYYPYSDAQTTQKPIIFGRHYVAITGKPHAATAGSMIFQKGGNAVDAACAMIAATCTEPSGVAQAIMRMITGLGGDKIHPVNKAYELSGYNFLRSSMRSSYLPSSANILSISKHSAALIRFRP